MLKNLRIHFLVRPTTITSFANNFFTNQLGIKYLVRCYSLVKLENLLYAGAGKIDFTQLPKSGVVSDSCPLKTVSVNQLGANNPVEDRFNIGLTQIDDSTSACLFTVLDGHSGTACVHAVVWSLLDYMYASIMSNEKLNTALEQLRAYDLNQPYHLIRRLDFVSPKNHRHLENPAGPPSNILSAYMRGRLRHYMEDLYARPNRVVNPSDCLIDAFKRLDEDLCSTDIPDNLLEIQQTLVSCTPDRYLNNSLSRDLLRVNLSGSVGVAGYVHWYDKLSDHPTELYLANVGDCGAVLLREVGSNEDGKMLLTPIKCTKPHNGYCNLDEINRIAMEHPENSVSELFRENGRLLGELAPCRSFGDVRYKWPVERLLQLRRFLEIMSTSNPDWSPIPYPYTSPPYLTAIPEVTRFELTPHDRYLVLATDGLWDMLSPEQVAIQLAEILQLIQQQKDFCPATQLLWSSLTNIPLQMSRAILPGPNYKDSIFEDLLRAPNLINKREHRKAITRALKLLSLPPGLARYNRDDITVMIIEFS